MVQQRANGKPVAVYGQKADTDLAFLKKLARRMVRITALDARGNPTLAFQGVALDASTDVMQQEWTLTYESIQRVLLALPFVQPPHQRLGLGAFLEGF